MSALIAGSGKKVTETGVEKPTRLNESKAKSLGEVKGGR